MNKTLTAYLFCFTGGLTLPARQNLTSPAHRPTLEPRPSSTRGIYVAASDIRLARSSGSYDCEPRSHVCRAGSLPVRVGTGHRCSRVSFATGLAAGVAGTQALAVGCQPHCRRRVGGQCGKTTGRSRGCGWSMAASIRALARIDTTSIGPGTHIDGHIFGVNHVWGIRSHHPGSR